MNLTRFKRLPIIGILRGVSPDRIRPLIRSIISSGLKTIEIAMNTSDASRVLREANRAAKSRLTIGAGTVLTTTDLKKALDSGASFIIMPTLVRDVAEYCAKKKIPFFPGALTPQEIYDAWGSGATMVKVFPAKFFGPGYLKEIKGPFKDIRLLACGGVSPYNIKSFFQSGASAVAFGESIFKKEWIRRKEFLRVEECIKDLISEFQK